MDKEPLLRHDLELETASPALEGQSTAGDCTPARSRAGAQRTKQLQSLRLLGPEVSLRTCVQ